MNLIYILIAVFSLAKIIKISTQVVGCGYYLMFASVLPKHISDMVLMIVLSIPSALTLLPAVLFLGRTEEDEEEKGGDKEEEEDEVIVLDNKAAANV